METVIRLSAALAIFFLMIAWEYLSPRRTQPSNRKQRWPVNLGLALLNMAVMRVTVGGIAYLSAVNAATQGFGLLNWLDAPVWLTTTITLLGLDFAIYCQHIVAHKWPLLWRFHQVHHTDIAFDATTAVRFHPVEIMISMAYKVLCIYLLGADPVAVIAFEIILNGAATFNHSNIAIAPNIDKKLRWLIITPDMHRIHHSTIPVETDSNYGFSIACWDRWCGTYRAEPKTDHARMDIGLTPYREQSELGFLTLLLMPFQALRR